MTERKLGRKLFSSGDRVMTFSDRSGHPYPYSEMIVEKGTGYLIHYTEDDGDANIQDVFKDPIPPPDAQRLRYVRVGPETVNSLFLYLYDKPSNEMLYTDHLEDDGVVVIL